MLAVADLLAAFTATMVIEAGSHDGGQLVRALAFLPAWIVVAKVCGLYDRDHRALRHLTVDDAPRLLIAAITSTFALAVFIELTGGVALTIADVARMALVAAASGLVLRGAARFLWRRGTPPERVAIIGEGVHAVAMRRKLELFPDMHAQVVRERPELSQAELADGASWLDIVDRIVVASSTVDEATIRRLVVLGRRKRVKVSVIPPVAGIFGTAVRLNHVADLPVVEYNTWDVSRSTLLLKRIVDVTASAPLLLLALPLMALVSVAIKLETRGPVLFRQRRAGFNGKPFWMLKLRTMVADAEQLLPGLVCLASIEQPVFKVPRDPRVTRVGRVLRRWSLDELPQLLNVLVGEMSLVGPRPEQVELVDRYERQHLLRLSVKPGITGPMQVFGRGSLSFEERLAVERDYVEDLSLASDLKILCLTVGAVVSGRGAL